MSLDAEAAQSHALRLSERFARRLADIGREPAEGDLPSHIVSFVVPDGDGVLQRLTAAGILVTLRAGRLRVGFHAFNDETDVDRCLLAVADAVGLDRQLTRREPKQEAEAVAAQLTRTARSGDAA